MNFLQEVFSPSRGDIVPKRPLSDGRGVSDRTRSSDVLALLSTRPASRLSELALSWLSSSGSSGTGMHTRPY